MRRFKNIAIITLLVILSLSAGVFAADSSRRAAKIDDLVLVIIHTNDLHGNLKPLTDLEMDKNEPVGGAAYSAAIINKIRAEYPGRTLLLDGGDLVVGTPLSTYYKGKPVFDVMNYLAYDAATIGNHEFDWGPQAMENMTAWSGFPLICANVVYRKNPLTTFLGMKPYLIKDLGDLRIGIVAVTFTDLSIFSKPEELKDLAFLDPATTVRRYIPLMKNEGASIIIVLSHLGFLQDQKLAEQVRGIDVIVGAHSHTRNHVTKRVRDTLIVQAGAYGKHVGRLILKIDPGTKTIKSYTEQNEIIPVIHRNIDPDPVILKIIEKYDRPIQAMLSRVLGEAPNDIVRPIDEKVGDIPMGNLVCDAIRSETGAQAAMLNRTGIRAAIYKGKITYEDVSRVLPFLNAVITMDIPGKSIVKVLERGAEIKVPIQVSGMTYSIYPNMPPGSRIGDVKISGVPLSNESYYRISTVDYLYNGGDGCKFEGAKKLVTIKMVADVFAKYIEKVKIITTPEVGRIRVINAKAERGIYGE